jgi:hypothetical protein
MNLLLWGALATAAAAIGLFFARFWRDSRDRLFLFFFLAFMILSLNWIGLALVPRDSESRHQVYVLRLVAFVLIIVGIIDKNRRARKNGLKSAAPGGAADAPADDRAGRGVEVHRDPHAGGR